MRIILVTICGVFLAGCSTELTPEAQLVRQITPQMTSNCKFLGPVSGTEIMGMTLADDTNSALNKLRNEVANRGGNAFVLTNSASTLDGANAQGDAYSCPS